RFVENHYIFSGAQILPNDIGISRDYLHFTIKPFKLLFLGRLSPEKGLDCLLKVIKELKNINLDIHLTVIGDGNQFNHIKNSVIKLKLGDSVTLKGKITEKEMLHQYMDNSHLLIIPSLTEGMPRVLIEAMARGMIVIGSKVGGIPELLTDEFLFEAGNVSAIADKVKELSNKPKYLSKISQQNLILSENHWFSNLKPIKDAFWEKIINKNNEA